MSQFNMMSSNKPQEVHISWQMVIVRDSNNERPDANDEGFWPSLDPKAAGWIGDNPEKNFSTQCWEAENRMKDWEEGKWYYVGVQARANILIPVGQGSFRTMTLESAGCWGIESDSHDYLAEVFEEEKQELIVQLTFFGKALDQKTFTEEMVGIVNED